MRGIAKLERTRTTDTRPYLLRGLMRCGIYGRRMQSAMIRKHHTYYRCLARTLAPGSAALADHPKTVNLREDDVLEPLNGWIGHLFGSENVDQTVAALIASQRETTPASNGRGTMTKRLADAEVYAMIDSLGDVGAALADARPESLSRPYQHLGLELRYEPHDRAVVVTASPRVINARVRGATCTLTTRLPLL